MIRAGDNDTSVIRSPAVRKAGRLDSYGAVRKPPPDDFPPELSSVFSGVSWTNVRKIITFVEKSPEISFSAAFHYIPYTKGGRIDDERKLGLPQRGYLYGESESI